MRAEGLIDLHNDPAVNRITEFAAIARTLTSDVGMLVHCYENLVRVAPRRRMQGKRYLHGRTGTTSSGSSSTQREQHLAVALYNASRGGAAFALPDRRPLAIIDYQMPLKARQDDLGVGKVDLFAVLDGRLPCVVELKVAGEKTCGDSAATGAIGGSGLLRDRRGQPRRHRRLRSPSGTCCRRVGRRWSSWRRTTIGPGTWSVRELGGGSPPSAVSSQAFGIP